MSGLEGDKFASLRAAFGFMYGHPGKETMERLQKCAPKEKIYVTMDVGQITMELDQRRRIQTKFER